MTGWSSDGPPPAEQRFRVLVVEDDAATIELLVLRLELLECDVAVAVTGEAALRLAREWAPELVLLDLKLDDDVYQGAELLSRLRDDPETAGMPVVIHSIYVNHPTDMREVTALAHGFLTKPFRVDDLRKLINGLRPTPEPNGR